MEQLPTFWGIFGAVVSIFSLIVLGAYYRYRGRLDAHADETLLWLVIHVCTPCLIIDSFLGNRALDDASNVIIAPILGCATVIIGMAMAYAIAPFMGFSEVTSQRTFISCVSLYNYGYIPIPIILTFFPKDVLGMLFIFNVGLDIALWTIGFILIVGRTSLRETLKRLATPPLLAIVISLLVNSFYDCNPLPISFARMIHMVGQGTIPLALLVVGATIFDYIPIVFPYLRWRPLLWGVFLRLFCIPLIFVAMAFCLDLPEQLRIVLCVQAGMPSAVLPILFVRKYGGDLPLAIQIVVATSALSLCTMPIWLSLTLAQLS